MAAAATGTEARARTRASTGTIALTFDDGPDPTWTPQVLAELERPASGLVPATMAPRSGAIALPRAPAVRERPGREPGLTARGEWVGESYRSTIRVQVTRFAIPLFQERRNR